MQVRSLPRVFKKPTMTNSTNNLYTTIRAGVVYLWKKNCCVPVFSMCRDAVSAIVYGDELVVNFRNGSTTVYHIAASGAYAYPVRTVR